MTSPDDTLPFDRGFEYGWWFRCGDTSTAAGWPNRLLEAGGVVRSEQLWARAKELSSRPSGHDHQHGHGHGHGH